MSGNVLKYAPGQTVTFYQEIKNSNHQYVDDGYTPVVTRIIYPGFTLALGYPKDMTRLDVGLYYFQFRLPAEDHFRHEHKREDEFYYRKEDKYKRARGECGERRDEFIHKRPQWNKPEEKCEPKYPILGTYFVDIVYMNPDTHLLVNDSRQVIVAAPFGLFSTRSVEKCL